MLAYTMNSLRAGWLGTLQRSRRRRPCKSSVHWLPEVAALEARTLLSTITVTNDSDSGAGSLRAALGAAVAGETINFAPSAYGTITLSSGPLEVATSVTIQGPGPKKVKINGNNSFEDLSVNANVTATVSGLTFTGGEVPASSYGGGGINNDGTLTVANCVVTGNSTPFSGGGINNNASLTVQNSVVSDNTGLYGGGISNNAGADLAVSGSTITDNTAPTSGGFGGGITDIGTATITGTVVSNNSADIGGGIYCGDVFGPASVTITGSTITQNTGNIGGGLEVQGGTATIGVSTFSNNTVGGSDATLATGGGIVAFGSATLNISGSLFKGDTAVAGGQFGLALGGAIYTTNFGGIAAGTLVISNSTFQGNTAVGSLDYGSGYGGAIHVDPGTNISVTGSSFADNTAMGGSVSEGGAVDLDTAYGNQASITGSTFFGNAAAVPASSLNSYGNADGGALYDDGPITVSGSSFTANRATGGSGQGFCFGGAIEEVGYSLNLSNSLLTANSVIGGSAGGGALGGGLMVFVGAATVDNTGFFGNQAVGGAASGTGNFAGFGQGGGIENSGTLTLTDCTVGANEATGGAGTDGALAGFGEGGGIQNSGSLTVSSSVIIGNNATGGAGGGNGWGGGILSFGSMNLTDTLVTLNQADGGNDGGQGVGGGLWLAPSSTTTLTGKTTVVLNFATTSNNNIYGTYST